MSDILYTAEIIGIEEIPENTIIGTHATSLAGIIVKPPIAPSEAFYNAVLGGHHYGAIKPAMTTREYATFLVIAREGDREQRTAYLEEIARKIGEYATNPALVVTASAARQRRIPDVDQNRP